MTVAPPDPVQEQLRQFHENGSRQALTQAFAALRREFAGPVARFLREAPTSPLVEQVLCDLLVDLLGVNKDTGKPPRALAPSDHTNPVAFRRRVLLNELRDRARSAKTYQSKITAHASAVTTRASTPPQEHVVELRRMRERVAALLPRLEIRRRAAVALELGIELPLTWIEELANHLGVSWGELLARLHAHEAAPFDEELKVRVLYGAQPRLTQAQDAFRQTLGRASAELEALLPRGRA